MKREVAAVIAGFSVENVRFKKPGDSHATLNLMFFAAFIKWRRYGIFAAKIDYIGPGSVELGFLFMGGAKHPAVCAIFKRAVVQYAVSVLNTA